MQKKHTGNPGLFIVVGVVYVCILLLFGWQTWGFVNWLFPNDQILMKALTMLCFDIMALIWAVIDLFYHHATRGTRAIVRWGWGISFFLSFIASILYLVLQSFTRFSITPNPAMVNTGYTVTIVAITVTVLLVTFWLYQEWSVRHPHDDDYEYEAARPEKPAKASTPVQSQLHKQRDTDPGIMPVRMQQTADVRSILAAMSVPPDHEDEVIEQLIKKGVLPAQEPPSPLV